MKETYNAAKVGLLVLLTLAASFAIYRFVDEGSRGEEGFLAYAVFDDVQGLVEKSRVVVAGIPVGVIEKIRLQGERARVDIRISGDVKLYKDATVAQRSASLLGETLLVIRPGNPKQKPLEAGDQIAAEAKGAGTDDIMKSVGEIADSVKKVTAQLERAFGTDVAGNQMAGALKDLSEAIAGVKRTIQTNEEVVNHTLENVESITTDARPKVEAILSHIEALTKNLDVVVGNNIKPADSDAGVGRIDDTLIAVQQAAHDLEATMRGAREISERTARGEGTVGRLTKDEKLINEVEGIVEGVNNVVGPIARLQTIVRLRSEYNFLANSFKNYVGLRLQPREDRYYRIELINDPRGRTTFTQRQVRTSPPIMGEPAYYQQTIAETKDAFRFTLQFAKRIHFATFRFGILESTGGLGLDLHLLDDNLEINADAFAIGEQKNARLRVAIAYQVLQRLFIVGGMDDMLNQSRDFFMGAQLQFNDEDLKSILPFVPRVPG
ncbi:MAG: Mce family protein [Myxococcaceae bacterium]|nr:Mce family protein [Myxococcaceae bacterium]